MTRRSFQQQRRGIATADERNQWVQHGERRGEAGHRRMGKQGKHPDSEDGSVGVGVGWDGRTKPLETKAKHARRQRAYIVKQREKKRREKKGGAGGSTTRRLAKFAEEGDTCGGSDLQGAHPGW